MRKEGMRHEYAQLDGIRLHYAECGSGEDLVILLHGFPECWYSWRHQLPVLGEKYRAVAPDMRGYNLSDKPAGSHNYGIEFLVNDVVGLINYFDKGKAAIVAHDWGAGVAWALAQRHPKLVSKLVAMQVPPPAAWRENLFFASCDIAGTCFSSNCRACLNGGRARMILPESKRCIGKPVSEKTLSRTRISLYIKKHCVSPVR